MDEIPIDAQALLNAVQEQRDAAMNEAAKATAAVASMGRVLAQTKAALDQAHARIARLEAQLEPAEGNTPE